MSDVVNRKSIEALLNPGSIAILGASDRPGSIGSIVLGSLRKCGFSGEVWPINPRYPELAGYRCFEGLKQLPGTPDVVAICTRGDTAPDHLQDILAVGGRAAVIYDGGFSETGEEGAARQREIAQFCQDNDIALCGPNCMGTINARTGATTYKLPLLDSAQLRGDVGLISQSGSITIGLLGDTRRFGFSTVVSTGNEAVLRAADYIDALVDDENTRTIALFIEQARDPQRFRAALERAANADKPVVVLKVGRSARAEFAVQSHTGGLAGEARVFSEMLRKAAAIEVNDIDEMTEVLAALQVRKRPSGGRIAVVTGSGGQAELVLDVAEVSGIELPPLSAASRAEAESVIGHLTGDGNPMDAWGNGDVARNLPHAFSVLNRDPSYDVVVLCNENIDNAPIGRAEGVMKLFCESARLSAKPHFALNMRPGLMHVGNVELLRAAGAGMLGGARQGLQAIDRVARFEQARRQLFTTTEPVEPIVLPGAGTSRTINEYDSKQILAGYGLPVGNEGLAQTVDEAVEMAMAIGWPVVLKVASDDMPHKTEMGVVKLGIKTESELRQAFAALAERVAHIKPKSLRGYLVQPMVSGGVEVFVGLKRDPEWGITILFGVGGILIELIRESAMRLLPVTSEDIDRMLRETRAWPLLCGVRGQPPADVETLASCIAAVARFGLAAGDSLAELDLNPIKVLPRGQGCRVLDALIVTR
ncbi:acetate--CoA ligase family protein [Microbacteriaceae bacterium K1510]|nr:acetate--CoA ligase family protein [Microbacteriaceae bacterium K1510]